MKLNVKGKPAAAAPVKDVASAMLELRRSVACCLLWEDGFYESGEEHAARVARLVAQCPFDFVAAVAVEAREVHGLRHAPLLLARELARHPERGSTSLKDLLPRIITRADQLAEFLALYWATNDGKKALPTQVKKGLAAAFAKFDAYALAKNARQSAAVKLRDVAFLTHPKHAKDGPEAGALEYKERLYYNGGALKSGVPGRGLVRRYKGSVLDQLCEGALPTPDTWEVKLSAAKTPSERQSVWLDLMAAGKLGGLAWLRNLRNMDKDDVPKSVVLAYGETLAQDNRFKGVFPHQFLTAGDLCPWAVDVLQPAMLSACAGLPRLPGYTDVLVDVSGSMGAKLSDKGDATRLDAACGLAAHAVEVCETARVWTFSDRLAQVRPGPRGFELADAIKKSQPHGRTALRAAVAELARYSCDEPPRLLVITDEQSTDGQPAYKAGGYLLNVGTDKKTVAGADSGFVSISGWAPAVLSYVAEIEKLG